MNKIFFSPEAEKDLLEIKQYIKTELLNEKAAKSTVSKIIRSIKTLSEFSESGTPLSAVIGFETDYRFLVCGNYITFYRFRDNSVYIIRILYGKRNYMQILFGGIS